MKQKVVIGVILVALVFLVSCTTTTSNIPPDKQCSADSDCVKAACCHAIGAVNKNFGPDCTGMMCTTECVPGTLDCQQGEIKCLNNECTVVLKDA